MDWGARLRAAWHGEVSNADLGAMFAAAARLGDLQQALADRRLAAEIEHAGHDWRALLAVGPLAAPLWLADALVALAGAFYDAESPTQAPARADHPSSISAYTHDLIADLLAPVEDILADVTAALADPGHRTALIAPLCVGPGGELAGERLPDYPSLSYARGLATGARRVHTSAAAALADARAAVAKSEAPDWLAAGLRRLDGEIQGAGARLDMSELRLTPLLGERSGGDPAALAAVCRDQWRVVDAAIVAGQAIADPHLLPEARTVSQRAAPATTPWPRSSVAPPIAPPPPRRTRPVPLPQIAEGAPSTSDRRDTAPAPERHPAPASLSLPVVGGQGDAPAAPAEQPRGHVELPAIGESSPPPPAPDFTSSHPPRSAPPRPPSGGESESGDEPPIRFPDIGT